jgi:hypothetical protein
MPRSSLQIWVRAVVIVSVALNFTGYAVYRQLMEPGPVVQETRFLNDAVRAERAAGLAALEAGEYSAAAKSFAQALQMSEHAGDCAELLRIAKELEQSRPSVSTR